MTSLVPEDWPQPYTLRTSILTGHTDLLYNGEVIGRIADETVAQYIKNVMNGHEVGWPKEWKGEEDGSRRDQH